MQGYWITDSENLLKAFDQASDVLLSQFTEPLQQITAMQSDKPSFSLEDELAGCRPTYAIERWRAFVKGICSI